MGEIKCSWCEAQNYRKIGIRKLVGRRKQIYYCKVCKKKFSGNYILGQPDPIVAGERKTYSQNWPAYNSAQTQEKLVFLQILEELCSRFEWQDSNKGRPKISLNDLIFACCLKTYSGFSGRRLNSDLELCQVQGYIKDVPHFNTLLNTFNLKELTPALQKVLRLSSFPLRELESNFSVDSTGFSTSIFSRWYDKKFGKDRTERVWVKAHAMIGTKTNVITSVEITEGHAADSPYFIPLVNSTAQDFKMKEISADKAYSSRENLEAVVSVGALPFIPFKNNATGKAKGSKVWSTMYRYFIHRTEEFYSRYHQRSNIESSFSMLKRKFSHKLNTKSFIGQSNEILCKAVCLNVCILIQEINEAGIHPELIYGSNDVLKIAKATAIQKPLNVQNG
jgi:transposase